MNPASIGKTLILAGLAVATAGVVLVLLGRIPGIGRLPGDIYMKREHFSFYIPLTTCLILSLVISLLFRILKK